MVQCSIAKVLILDETSRLAKNSLSPWTMYCMVAQNAPYRCSPYPAKCSSPSLGREPLWLVTPNLLHALKVLHRGLPLTICQSQQKPQWRWSPPSLIYDPEVPSKPKKIQRSRQLEIKVPQADHINVWIMRLGFPRFFSWGWNTCMIVCIIWLRLNCISRGLPDRCHRLLHLLSLLIAKVAG